MTLEVRRLKTLNRALIGQLARLMSEEIAFDNPVSGSSWVCWWQQQARFWTEERIARLADLDALGDAYRAWVALDGGQVVAVCAVAVEPKALLLTAFLVNSRAYKEPEQFAIADELALAGLVDIPERDEIYGHFPTSGFAARYATRCGFESMIPGKPSIIEANPLRRWWHNPKKLEERIRTLSADNRNR